MTDVIDRSAGPNDRGLLDPSARPPVREMTDGATPEHRMPRATTTGGIVRGCVALLLVGASAIHFGMMGEHAGVSWTHGLFFALVAWAQLGLAVLVVSRRTRPVVLAVVVVNVAVLGVWVVSRTAGIAIGGDGTPEAWGWVDGLCAGFEVVAVLLSLTLLARSMTRRPLSQGVGYGAVAFIGVLVVALTAWIFSPSVTDSGAAADGHAHSNGGAAPAAGAGHTHAAANVDDKGLAALSNGHHHAFGPEKPLDSATRVQLTNQMNVTIEVARAYPTVAAAEAAGYRRAGPYSPGLGAHYIAYGAGELNPAGTMTDDALRHPLAIIYDGTNPDSRVAGFMYYSMSKARPTGFAGPNDNWHYHESICIKYTPTGVDAPFGADKDATKAQCDSVGGTILKQTQWMVHVWSVPGWESAQGLFGEVNPALACPDGTYYERPAKEWAAHPLNICKSAA